MGGGRGRGAVHSGGTTRLESQAYSRGQLRGDCCGVIFLRRGLFFLSLLDIGVVALAPSSPASLLLWRRPMLVMVPIAGVIVVRVLCYEDDVCCCCCCRRVLRVSSAACRTTDLA